MHSLTEKFKEAWPVMSWDKADSIIRQWLEEKGREILNANQTHYKGTGVFKILGLESTGTVVSGKDGGFEMAGTTDLLDRVEKHDPNDFLIKPKEEPMKYVDTCKHIRYPIEYNFCPLCGERILDGSKEAKLK